MTDILLSTVLPVVGGFISAAIGYGIGYKDGKEDTELELAPPF